MSPSKPVRPQIVRDAGRAGGLGPRARGSWCDRLRWYLQLLRLGIVHTEGLHGDLLHALVLLGLVAEVGLDGGDAVHHVHALGDFAEGGVLAVQEVPVGVHDEELAAGRVHGLGPGHGEHAPLVAQVVLHAVGGELTLDAVARAADAHALGVAPLDHETGDDPVEDQAVIKPLAGQADEVVHRDGGHFGVEFRDDLAAVLHLNGNNGILCHSNRFLSVPVIRRDTMDCLDGRDHRRCSFRARSISRLASFLAAASRLS